MATENANKHGSETAHGATSELDSTGWLGSLNKLLRQVLCAMRGHGGMSQVNGWPAWYWRCKRCDRILNLH